MATVADFALVNQGFDALGRSLLQRKLAEDKDAEDIRRALLDRQLQEYRNKELDLHSSDLQDQRANRAAAVAAQTQHYKATEESAKQQQAVQMLHALGQQVQSGTLAPETATQLLQQHLDSTTQGTPFKFSVAFQAPKSPNLSYSEDPVSGVRHAVFGNQMQSSGVNPALAKRPTAYKTVMDEAGNPTRLPLTDEEVAALKNPPPAPGSFEEQLSETGMTPDEYQSIQTQLEREADFKKLKKQAKAGTLDTSAMQQPAGPTRTTAPATPKTQADYDSLPSGTLYIDPATGATKRKK